MMTYALGCALVCVLTASHMPFTSSHSYMHLDPLEAVDHITQGEVGHALVWKVQEAMHLDPV